METEKVTNGISINGKYFLIVLTYTMFSIFYFVFRYGGYWSEWDSAYLTTASDIVYQQGVIIPDGIKYNNGFGLQVLITFLVHVTGLSTHTVSQYLVPFLGAIIVFIAFPLFFEFTNDKKIALLATLLLVLAPDVFMQLVRVKHIKFFIMLTSIALFCICKSFSDKSNRMIYILLSQMSIVGCIFYNTYYGSSLSIILFITFIISELFNRKDLSSFSFSRLGTTTILTTVFSFFNMAWIYTPSLSFIYYMNNLKERLIAVLLFAEPMTDLQYNYIMDTWRPPEIFLILRLFDFIISPLSFILYLSTMYSIIRNKSKYKQSYLLLIFFYTALGLILTSVIIGDRSGGIASNMQLGFYPIFMILIAPLASIQIFNILNYLRKRDLTTGLYLYKYLIVFSIILFIIFSASSLIKITNDPAVSNKWQFYTLQEKHGIMWAATYLNEDTFWGGIDERLSNVVYQYPELYYSKKFRYTSFNFAQTVLMSDTIIKRVEVAKYPLEISNLSDAAILYSAGQVNIYRRSEIENFNNQ